MKKKLLSIAIAFPAIAAFGIGASQEWVKDYVKTSAPTTNVIDSVNAILNAKNDDEIKVTEDGQIYFTTLECINGIYTNVTHYLSPASAEWVKGTYHGVKITESNNPIFKRGDILALAYGNDGTSYYVNDERMLTVRTRIENNVFLLYVSDIGWSGSVPFSEKRLVVEQKDEKGNATSYFVLEPMLMFEETWKDLVKEEDGFSHNPSAIPWANDAVIAERQLEMRCTYGLPKRKMMMRSGLEEQPTKIIIKFRDYPKANYVDTIDYAVAYGYKVDIDGTLETPTKDNCWADPTEIIPEAEWNRFETWLDLDGDKLSPSQIVIVYYKADDGLYYPVEKKIRTLTALMLLVAQYPGTVFPPFPWPGFTLTAKIDCRKSGDHIFGKNCECIVCGHKREHKFLDAKDGLCSRCENYFDEYTINRRGEKKKTGNVTEEKCGLTPKQAGGDVSELALHSGWWHQSVDGDTQYNCSCECGFYSTDKDGHSLAHEYDPDAVLTWQKADKNGNIDGVHHFAYSECTRCHDAQKEIKERHELEIPEGEREDGSSEPYNDEFHHTQGICKDCHFGETDEENAVILEEHSLNESCFCRLCNQYIHSWSTSFCGTKMNQYCDRCGVINETGPDSSKQGHDYGNPLPEWHDDYYTHHQCFCSLGELETHTFENGVCSVCGMRQKTGVKCASKKRGPKAPDSGSVNSDSVHTSDRSGTGGFFCTDLNDPDESDHACPDCGGGFFIDYPEAKAFASEPGAWEYTMSGAMGAETRRWRGEDAALTNTLRTVNSLIGIIERAEKNIGTRVEIKVKWNPITAIELTFENFAFLPGARAIYGELWGSEAIYSGSILNDPDFGVIIDWK